MAQLNGQEFLLNEQTTWGEVGSQVARQMGWQRDANLPAAELFLTESEFDGYLQMAMRAVCTQSSLYASQALLAALEDTLKGLGLAVQVSAGFGRDFTNGFEGMTFKFTDPRNPTETAAK